MAFRRMTLLLLAGALVLAACGGDSGDESGVFVQEPIGAPDDQDYDSSTTSSSKRATTTTTTAVDAGPSVIKEASMAVDVVSDELTSSAQAVIDIATGPSVGGFLVSSVLDTQQDYGFGNVTVRVPAPRFEEVVGELSSIGKVTRQELQGQDLSSDFLEARTRVQLAEQRVAALLRKKSAASDPGASFEIEQNVADAKATLAKLQQNESYIEGATQYSTIDVALNGTPPSPVKEKPALERALSTAKDISLSIVSAIVLAAGVVLPIGALCFVLYVLGLMIVRRVKPRLQSEA